MSIRSFSPAFMLLCSALPLAVIAAPTPGEQELIRDRQGRLLQEQQRRLDELRELPGKPATPSTPAAPASQTCFAVQTIALAGAEVLSHQQRDTLIGPYLKRCLGVEQLNQILKVITNYYIEKGLVTSRAYLPQQDLSTGHLQIIVVEGRLENLSATANSGLSARELAMAFPGAQGERLNLREIEQLLEQLNRLPSNQARMELAPGKQLGGSDVRVDNTAQAPWRLSLSRHNDGQKSTGEQQWNAGLDWDSPLGLADQLALRASHDAVSDHTQGSRSTSLIYGLPWGWWTFNYSYSKSQYHSLASAQGFPFTQRGDSETQALRAERVIARDALSKTSLSMGVSHLRTNNYVDDAHVGYSSNRLSEVQYGFNHGRRVGSAFVNFDWGLQQGVGAFRAQGSRAPEPDARYRKYTATLSYLQPFQLWGEQLTFSSLATGQRSATPLYSSQRLSLGGSSSVRGYKDQFLSGDSGGYWRSDLRLRRPVTLDWLRPVLSEYGVAVGYDQGVISNDRYNGHVHGRLTSHSTELFARGRYLALSLTRAHSLQRPAGLIEREAPIYARLDFFL